MKKIYLLTLLSLLFGLVAQAQDQAIDDQEIVNVESLYSTPSQKPKAAVVEELPADNTEAAIEVQSEAAPPPPPKKVDSLTDLNELSPFREVSVIQKKFLPKTGRFQLYGAGGMTTNSPWFLNLGFKLNLGYHFTESLGIEVTGIFLSNSERDVSKEIRENNGLQPEKFVNTKSHVGGHIFWSPIYGKMTFINDRIIPFDMYFVAGLGTSETNSQEGSNTTYHIGTGQIFALSKSMAFRWDYSFHFFQATPKPDSTSTSAPSSNSYNDLILTAGLSFFFPEVSQR